MAVKALCRWKMLTYWKTNQPTKKTKTKNQHPKPQQKPTYVCQHFQKLPLIECQSFVSEKHHDEFSLNIWIVSKRLKYGICFQNCHIQDPNPGNASCGAHKCWSKCPVLRKGPVTFSPLDGCVVYCSVSPDNSWTCYDKAGISIYAGYELGG